MQNNDIPKEIMDYLALLVYNVYHLHNQNNLTDPANYPPFYPIQENDETALNHMLGYKKAIEWAVNEHPDHDFKSFFGWQRYSNEEILIYLKKKYEQCCTTLEDYYSK
ncbi:MAG: hypothetical protein M3R17_18020 [Bacteroidota bacterium]|nr:hypothetical protein [Bacteroidota bacterium]